MMVLVTLLTMQIVKKMDSFEPRGFFNKITHEEITYTGKDKLNLNIKAGDSFSRLIDAVEALATTVKDLEQKVSFLLESKEVDSSKVKAVSALYDLVDESVAISHILQDKPMNLELREGGTSLQADVLFDFSEALSSLGSKYVPIGTNTSIRTYTENKLLASSSSKSGVLVIDKPTQPIVVNSKINLKGPEGDLVLSKSFYIPTFIPQKIVGKFKVSGLDIPQANDITQKDFNEILASSVSKLQKDIAYIERRFAID